MMMNAQRLSYPSSSRTSSHLSELIRLIGRLDEKVVYEFNLETFLYSLNLTYLNQLDDEALRLELVDVDAMDLLQAVKELTQELTTLKLENHYMTHFLEKNDAKQLIGLKQLRERRSTAPTTTKTTTKYLRRATRDNSRTISGQTSNFATSKQSVASSTQSLATTTASMASSFKKAKADFELNYRAKNEMAGKTVNELEKLIGFAQSKGTKELKNLRAHIVELRNTAAEAQEAIKNFQLHFLNTAQDLKFLQKATELEIERKFHTFMTNLMKNGQALLASIHFNLSSLYESCRRDRRDLMSKSELSGNLRAVDFKVLKLKRNALEAALEEEMNALNGLKYATGKASSSVAEEKRTMESLEISSHQINGKIVETLQTIAKLHKEAQIIEKKNVKDMKSLANLQEQIDRYEAPSVGEYHARKLDVVAMEKEIAILKRKINILRIKFKNVKAACKRQKS